MPSNYDLTLIGNRLLKTRTSILMNNPFYGLLLMHVPFALDNSIETACTDGRKIYFSPKFMSELNDKELEFILLHEIMHITLQHMTRLRNKDPYLANVACDIVVNSNILYSKGNDISSITLAKYGPSMHLTPNKEEGYKYTVEEVYEMFRKKYNDSIDSSKGIPDKLKPLLKQTFDNHSKWKDVMNDDAFKDVWNSRIINAANALNKNQLANLPLGIQRAINDIKNPKLDWRVLLHNFIEEDISDYSFNPPDRRYDDSPFYLPDFNEPVDKVRNILFMIDASASMSKEDITEMYSEIKGAIDQFNGRLSGYLGFFDASVTTPIAFNDLTEFKMIKPYGGGGTSFECIFNYVNKNMKDNPPSSIIILTDGYASIPKEEIRNNIPVLWVINNEEITPEWGKVIRIN